MVLYTSCSPAECIINIHFPFRFAPTLDRDFMLADDADDDDDDEEEEEEEEEDTDDEDDDVALFRYELLKLED